MDDEPPGFEKRAIKPHEPDNSQEKISVFKVESAYIIPGTCFYNSFHEKTHQEQHSN